MGLFTFIDNLVLTKRNRETGSTTSYRPISSLTTDKWRATEKSFWRRKEIFIGIASDLGPWNRFIIDWVTAKLTGEEVEKKVGVPTMHTFFTNFP
jgi:hypothetical protein